MINDIQYQKNMTFRFFEKKSSENELSYIPLDSISKKAAAMLPRIKRKLELTSTTFRYLKCSGFNIEVER